jgi:cytoskeletal protein CcmA (bactofilin family)
MLFMKKKKKRLQQLDTVIGAETVLQGNITVETSLRIDGKVLGEVVCEGDVTIGEGGFVESSVTARNIIIAGSLRGMAKASEKLHILPTGNFSGTTMLNSIVIEEGGIFEGESKMNHRDSLNDTVEVNNVEQNDLQLEETAN